MPCLTNFLFLQVVAVEVTEGVDWGVNTVHSDRIDTYLCGVNLHFRETRKDCGTV